MYVVLFYIHDSTILVGCLTEVFILKTNVIIKFICESTVLVVVAKNKT